jgi:hypothetical protein
MTAQKGLGALRTVLEMIEFGPIADPPIHDYCRCRALRLRFVLRSEAEVGAGGEAPGVVPGAGGPGSGAEPRF